jgi:hypothetical protein
MRYKKWIHRLTSPSGEWKFKMLDGCDFLCDPYRVIKHYKTCELNPQTTGENLVLGTVYRIVTGGDLDNAHNSLFDALDQKTVMLDQHHLQKFFDTKVSIQPIEDALSAKERNETKQWDELTRPVPNGLVKETAGDETEWEPLPAHSYFGREGGPKHGPSKPARDAAMAPDAKIMVLFLFLIPLELLKRIVEHTHNYARCDFVRPVGATDQNGKARKKCGINDEGARHKTTKGLATVSMTVGYLLAWIGMLIAIGAYKLRKARLIWMEAP